MGKPTGFIEFRRELPTRRPVPERINDFLEVYNPFDDEKLRARARVAWIAGSPSVIRAARWAT